MNVTLPNGTVISGVPEGATREQVKRKAIANGLATEADFSPVVATTEAVQTPQAEVAVETVETPGGGVFSSVKRAFTGEERMTPEMESLPEIGAAPELNQLSVPAFKASLGLLSTGDTESLKGILNQQFGEGVSYREDSKGNVIVSLESGDYALNKPGLSAQDVVRGAFDVLAFTPAGRAATIPRAMAGSAATEAGISATEQALGGQDIQAEDIAMAGALGGGFKAAEDLIGAGYRAVTGDPASDVVAAGREAGIPVMTSDIRQPQTFAGRMAQQTGEKIPIAGTGGLRERQQGLREAALEDIAQKYGQFSYSDIATSLKNRRDSVKRAAGNVLERAGNKLDEVGEIPLTRTQAAIDSVRQELSRPGVIQSSDATDNLNTLVEAIGEVPQTYSSLKENRTAFREIVKAADKAERSQLTTRAKSLLQRVESAMKADMDSFARQNLTANEFAKLNRANAVYADEAKKMTRSRLKNVLDRGDVTPESVETMLFSQKPSEVRMLYNSLTEQGRNNARSAIISRVINDLSKRASGVTPNAFASEMKKRGLQKDVFFKGEEARKLNGLLKVLNATRRAQEAPITTPTGQQLLGAGTLAAAATDLGATIGLGGTAGGFARLYESAPVRNALLRLDSIPPGSTRFEQALREAVAVMSSTAQAARSEISDTQ